MPAELSIKITVYEWAREEFPMLSLDPGVTMGACWAEYDKGVLACQTFTLCWPEDALVLRELLRHAHGIVVEDFRVYPQTSAASSIGQVALSPVEVMGFVRGSLLETGVVAHWQMASQAKQTWPDLQLHERLDKVPTVRHERDALRHLLTYLTLAHLHKRG